MTKLTRRLVQCLVLSMILFCMLLLCSCNKEDSHEAIAPVTSQQTTESVNLNVQDGEDTYLLKIEDFQEGGFALNSRAVPEGAMIWGLHYREDVDDVEIILNRYGSSGNISEDILLLKQNQWLSAPCTDEKGTSFILSETNEDQVSQALQINHDTRVDLNAYLNEGQEVQWTFHTDDTIVCLTEDGYIFAFDFDGSFAWKQQLHLDVLAAFQCEDKQIVLITKEQTKNAEMMFQTLNSQKQAAEPICNVPENLLNARFFSGQKWNYDVMAYDSAYLYGWNFCSSDLVRLLKFEDLGIAASRISTMECSNSDCILGIYGPSGSDCDRLFQIEKTDQAEEKTEIIISGLSCPMSFKTAIADFNLMHPEYLLKYIDYNEQYGEKAVDQLNLDLITGTAPDLILGNGLDYQIYAQKGLLEDLYLMMEHDELYSREKFLPNLLQSIESDGKLYYLPQSFSIAGVTGLKEIFGTKTYNSVSDLFSAQQQLEENSTLFFNQTWETLVSDVLLHGYKSFINTDTHKANFNSDEFKEILELIYCEDKKAVQEIDFESDLSAQMNKQCLLRGVLISRADQFDEMLIETNDKIVCMGYPGTNGPVFYLNNPVMITSHSSNKDAAWEFIKFLVASEQYTQGRGWLPLISKIEESFDEDMDNGTRDTTIASIKNIIWSMDQTAYYNKNIFDIIWSELQPYFNDQQTSEDTAEHINNRVQLYLDEK